MVTLMHHYNGYIEMIDMIDIKECIWGIDHNLKVQVAVQVEVRSVQVAANVMKSMLAVLQTVQQ